MSSAWLGLGERMDDHFRRAISKAHIDELRSKVISSRTRAVILHKECMPAVLISKRQLQTSNVFLYRVAYSSTMRAECSHVGHLYHNGPGDALNL